MHCDDVPRRRLLVETDQSFYEIEFGQIQIEITGRCNMRCQHCRAANELRADMPIEQIVKVVRFARLFSPNYKEIVISGGEPLMHSQFTRAMRLIRNNGGDFVTLTTNGSHLERWHLDLIESLNFKRFILSVSLDSLDPQEHDSFRHSRGAFDNALRAIRMIVRRRLPNVTASVRTTIRPEQIGLIDDIVAYVHDLGCKRSSLSAIHPAGRAIDRPDFWMNKAQKRRFIETVYRLKEKYKDEDFDVSTNDPLKCIVRGYHDIGVDESDLVFDGCAAAACTFNVGADGTMTPCSLLNLPMMNVFPLSVDEMIEKYSNNGIVKNMLDMNLRGKCGKCSIKYQCGGCRARALIRNDHYLEEDPDCWVGD